MFIVVSTANRWGLSGYVYDQSSVLKHPLTTGQCGKYLGNCRLGTKVLDTHATVTQLIGAETHVCNFFEEKKTREPSSSGSVDLLSLDFSCNFYILYSWQFSSRKCLQTRSIIYADKKSVFWSCCRKRIYKPHYVFFRNRYSVSNLSETCNNSSTTKSYFQVIFSNTVSNTRCWTMQFWSSQERTYRSTIIVQWVCEYKTRLSIQSTE